MPSLLYFALWWISSYATDDVEKEEDEQIDDKVENLEISGKNNVSIESTYITNIGKIFF